MSDPQIICPNCSSEIPLTETLTNQVKTQLKKELTAENKKLQDNLNQQKQVLDEQKKQIVVEKQEISKKIAEELEKEKIQLWQKAKEEASKKNDLELKDLQEQNKEINDKLANAQKNELELRKQTRELEEQKKNLDLEMQRKLDAERGKLIEQTRKESDDAMRLKILEKDKAMEMLRKTIEDLKRKSEQGSMQIQGEVQEDDLKNFLQTTFPADTIEDVPQGIRGADLIQTINGALGQNLGIILWESKNTKTWSNDWTQKLKQDQGLAKADICILVSQVLPDIIKGFGTINGVWVTDYSLIISLAQMLRFHLMEINRAKSSYLGQDEKMEILYNYITSSQFKNRIENLMNTFSDMKKGLDTEKNSLQRIWNRREKNIERLMFNTSGFYGDLQGIIGNSLDTIKSLELTDGLEDEDLEEEETDEPTQPPKPIKIAQENKNNQSTLI